MSQREEWSDSTEIRSQGIHGPPFSMLTTAVRTRLTGIISPFFIANWNDSHGTAEGSATGKRKTKISSTDYTAQWVKAMRDQDHESCHSAKKKKSTVLWSRPIPVMLCPVNSGLPPIPRPSHPDRLTALIKKKKSLTCPYQFEARAIKARDQHGCQHLKPHGHTTDAKWTDPFNCAV